MAGRLSNKVCAVTGGAQGIGMGIVRALTAEDAAVVIVDLDIEIAGRLTDELSGQGHKVAAVQADVSDRGQIASAFDEAIAIFGGLDVVFNNAGFNSPMKFLEVTEQNWTQIQKVNGLGVLIGVQEAAKRMIAAGKGGKIINTTSIAGRQGFPDFVPYCAAKAGVIMITQGAAKELAQYGVTVNGFAPGVVETPLWDKLDEDLIKIGASEKPGQAIVDFSQGILLGRVAQPEDLGPLGVFLASSDSDYMTGQIVMIDGGMVLV